MPACLAIVRVCVYMCARVLSSFQWILHICKRTPFKQMTSAAHHVFLRPHIMTVHKAVCTHHLFGDGIVCTRHAIVYCAVGCPVLCAGPCGAVQYEVLCCVWHLTGAMRTYSHPVPEGSRSRTTQTVGFRIPKANYFPEKQLKHSSRNSVGSGDWPQKSGGNALIPSL